MVHAFYAHAKIENVTLTNVMMKFKTFLLDSKMSHWNLKALSHQYHDNIISRHGSAIVKELNQTIYESLPEDEQGVIDQLISFLRRQELESSKFDWSSDSLGTFFDILSVLSSWGLPCCGDT